MSGETRTATGPLADRPTLAQRQAALVRALVAGDAAPAGFDAGDLAATAHGLLHKRAEEVRRRFPHLAHAVGADFTARYLEWARTRPKTTTVGDAAAFARALGLPDPRPGRARPRWRRLGR
ncbi:hypothetical protein D7D52_21735 [Nocardia yunnanensis]|uniref:SCO6045-like C-terminal domain-containing protein n=1 Tax=Nocardia yunnanensis TaxID=2382165 RepID=A0A386ZFU6_9NOCA|nr:hypothetical protein [Nocardia yunnanensis]AYF76024.1 hypothetical protein D7D52_21735 [Nocardia yunnanensis]